MHTTNTCSLLQEALAPALVPQLGAIMAVLPASHRTQLLHLLPTLALQPGKD